MGLKDGSALLGYQLDGLLGRCAERGVGMAREWLEVRQRALGIGPHVAQFDSRSAFLVYRAALEVIDVTFHEHIAHRLWALHASGHSTRPRLAPPAGGSRFFRGGLFAA